MVNCKDCKFWMSAAGEWGRCMAITVFFYPEKLAAIDTNSEGDFRTKAVFGCVSGEQK